MSQCEFADAILFSDTAVDGSFRNVMIAKLTSLEDYSRFCLRELPRLIATRFVLVIQWDGYVVDASAWQTSFREYDYIGALAFWPKVGPRVGNGGFSLRSRRLLQALASLPAVPRVPEDYYICKVFREPLERQFAIRFAPANIAQMFAYQHRYPGHPTFGFHGLYNLWRYTDDRELADLTSSLTGKELIHPRFLELILSCLRNGRGAAASTLYTQLRRDHGFEVIRHRTSRVFAMPARRLGALRAMEALERMHARP